ncbi:S-layer homology domain-containing protein [Sporosarcina sp. HYO08]|uniref:S-layer homology domain-containing protein n=1 Tax=Sporosarcina sp. HYO08 TaxID=1759557 RepID=UPI0007993DE8|nr:S-layer homology domain-containing protein [Sporosarcina sp. HYO08]KXH78783.1 Parasporal protein [Sporosarcina sp. HYO08]
MARTTRITSWLIIVLLLFTLKTPLITSASSDNFLPFEDQELGRNSNAYLSIYKSFPIESKTDFIQEIAVYANAANEKWGIPASAIIGMAAIESGYGTTRIAVNANNIFGIKVWGNHPVNAWQLKGQPDEDYEKIPVLANYGVDRIVYDETKRRDNWYRMFSSYEEAVNYLAGTLLVNQRYNFAKKNYESNLKNGWSYEQASKQYVYEIAHAGYNHLGGEYYRNLVGKLMTEWDLYQYDQNSFKDIRGTWAQKEIEFLVEKGWISGYSDGTFKPNDEVTRAQAAKMISSFLGLTSTTEDIHFNDVPNDFWGVNSIVLVAQHQLMNGMSHLEFSPNTNLTRSQMAQIFYNAGFYHREMNPHMNSFKDVHKNHWAYTAIETMKQEGVMAGYTDGRFGVNEPITRAQMAAVIYRLYEQGWNQ